MALQILHNPRCSKSREALALLESRGIRPQVIEYLATPLSLDELRTLQRQLGAPVRAMLREGEDDYRELGLADASLSDTQLLQAIAERPALLQRPIVVDGDRALIARPPALLNDWLR
ncbi:arsenate reductase (glutaredoxin) [Roseateles sp. MS654]|uniref:arsenate reductase (glutaredoxin) n=1 Tax=Roseateles sp. MS654 TaxID=3412685 RepID=UPI003C2E20F4